LEFTILTTARVGEVLGATWDDIILADKVWRIPAARMKARREHRVPLAPMAIDLLQSLPRTGERVFPGAHENGVLKVVKAIAPNATVHGFRSTFRDWAAEKTHYPNHVVEMALAHAIPSAVEAAYRRGDLFEKRRALMNDWASYCATRLVTKDSDDG
jgi:integrase